jgi:hypothetical protein
LSAGPPHLAALMRPMPLAAVQQIEAAIVKLTAYLRGSKAAPVVSRGKYDDFIALVKQWTDDNMPDDDFFYQVTRFLPKDADA